MPEQRDRPRDDQTAPLLSEDAPSVDTRPTSPESDTPPPIPDDHPRLVELQAQLAEMKNDYLRALAEVENTRRRASRDREDARQYAITGFARDLLSVADNLRRALDAVDTEARAGNADLDTLMNGVDLTEKELLSVLERHGVVPIAAMGAPFDPHIHEAMFEIPDESVPSGTVVQVLQTGYVLHDRTLRPATVGVSRGGPKRATPEQKETRTAPETTDESTEDDDDEPIVGAPGEEATMARASASAYGTTSHAFAGAGSRVNKTL